MINIEKKSFFGQIPWLTFSFAFAVWPNKWVIRTHAYHSSYWGTVFNLACLGKVTRSVYFTRVLTLRIYTCHSEWTVGIYFTLGLNWCNCYKTKWMILVMSTLGLILRLMQATKPLPRVPWLQVQSGWWLTPLQVASVVQAFWPHTGPQVWLMKSHAWSWRQSLSVLHSTLIHATNGFPCNPTEQTHLAWWNSTRHSAPRPQGLSELRQGFKQFSLIQARLTGQSLSTRHSAEEM